MSTSLAACLPDSWRPLLSAELTQPYSARLDGFAAAQRAAQRVFPREEGVFTALKVGAPDEVGVVLLGQGPYHDDGQAHGLAFSVRPGIKPPPSLANIFAELKSDLGCHPPNNGYLVPWAKQGVLLLNAVLTVRAHQPNSHKNQGWERFTDAVIRAVNSRPEPVVFVLWGGYAQKKVPLVDTARHVIVQSAHPSPLSARNGFFGSKPFSKINTALRATGKPVIDWQLPNM